MKKRIGAFVLALSLIGFYCPTAVFATGYPVFDVSGWLTAIDQLYQAYDMVNNTITQIENQYKQIQHSIEVAKSIDWNNIRFDGDFDIRNDIKDANRRVNRMLTQARNIKETLTTPSINCGTARYSIADLCGAGRDGLDFSTAVTDYKNFMTDTMKSAVSAVVDGLEDDQKQAIWAKYGISPKNYVFVQQSVNQVKRAATAVMGKVTDEAKQMQREQRVKESNAVMQAVYESKDSEGNPTSAAMQEALLHLMEQLNMGTLSMEEAINELSNLMASKMIAEENEKQSNADAATEEQERQEAFDNRVPDSFIK